jgi:single-strand DNA-binding protein
MLNKVQLIGRLGADPEVKTMDSGNSVCNVSVATNEIWYDKKTSQKVDKTEWHRVVIWGKNVENIGKYLRKGSLAYFEGKIQTREWDDKDGNKRYSTEVVASQVKFLDSKNSEGSDNRQYIAPAPSSGPNPSDAGIVDDIPF